MPAHPVPAHEDILQRVVEGVAHMQAAGHVGRRDHDREGLGARLRIGPGGKGPGLFPRLVKPRLGRFRVECLVHRHHVSSLQDHGFRLP
jgi:hypothetical protein